MSSARDLDQIISTLVGRAPELRAAGVLSLTLGDLTVALAPAEPVAAEPRAPRERVEEEPADPLSDPATFGFRNAVPGFPRRREEDEEQ